MIGAGQSQFDTGRANCTFNPLTTPPSYTCPILSGMTQAQSDSYRTSQENSGILVRGVGIAVAGVGLAGIVGGLVWHFVEPTGPAKTATFLPAIGPGYAGLSFGASF